MFSAFLTLLLAISGDGTYCANGQDANSKPLVKLSDYISPINGSRFWGLNNSDNPSVTSLLGSPLAADLVISDVQLDQLRSIYTPIAKRNNYIIALRDPIGWRSVGTRCKNCSNGQTSDWHFGMR